MKVFISTRYTFSLTLLDLVHLYIVIADAFFIDNVSKELISFLLTGTCLRLVQPLGTFVVLCAAGHHVRLDLVRWQECHQRCTACPQWAARSSSGNVLRPMLNKIYFQFNIVRSCDPLYHNCLGIATQCAHLINVELSDTNFQCHELLPKINKDSLVTNHFLSVYSSVLDTFMWFFNCVCFCSAGLWQIQVS